MAVQVIAALGYASLGTVALALLDLAVRPQAVDAQDISASAAVIAPSHFAGNALAQARQVRADRAAEASSSLLPHLEAARIKTTAETVKALYEAGAPIVAGAAALWAAFSNLLS